MREGDQVSFDRRRSGARAYLAVADGFRLERVLGSRTTNLRAGFGGWHGRRLEKGDLLPLMGSFANPPRLLIPDSLAHVIGAAPLRPRESLHHHPTVGSHGQSPSGANTVAGCTP